MRGRVMMIGAGLAAVLAVSAVTAASAPAQGGKGSGPTLRTQAYAVSNEKPGLTWVGKGQLEIPKCSPEICPTKGKTDCALDEQPPIEDTKYFEEDGRVYDVLPHGFLREQAVQCEETAISVLGPAELEGEVIPAVVSLTTKGIGTIKSLLPEVGLVMSFEEGPTCTFQTSKVTLVFPVGEVGKAIPFQPSINNQAFKLDREHANPTCPKEIVLRESFSVYGEGEELVYVEP